ncbi:WIAG-tail domain [Brevibacillus laterosporus]|uniref:WIAG-tail domain n=1 Tax=Brevibacillus laterosporus TaxID=1465 RepID=UPI00264F9C54|nr:WIAG-tail domain [Brevibacillus laterosporus]MDN9008946.1 WIAG-tail domain [Brevibacillus laterosporus]MDO0941053.1 WIAG-tail domain [Brevibacillus laterosporus]
MAKQNLQKQNIKNRQRKLKKKNKALQELDALETALINNWIDDSSDFYIQEEETSIPHSANDVKTLLQESSQMEIYKPNRSQPKKRKQRSRRKPKRYSSKRSPTYSDLKLVSSKIPQSQQHFITKWNDDEKSNDEESPYSGVPSYYEESDCKLVDAKPSIDDQIFSQLPHQVAQIMCTMPEVFGLTEQHLQPLAVLTRHLQDFLNAEKKIEGEQAVSNQSDASVVDASIVENQIASDPSSDPSQVLLDQPPNQLEIIDLQQVGKESFTLQQGRVRTSLTINLTEPFQEKEYVFMATTDIPFCFVVVEKKESDKVTIEIIRQIANREVSGQVEWIAIGTKRVENQMVEIVE